MDYLKTLYRFSPTSHLCVVYTQGTRHPSNIAWFPVSDLDRAAETIIELSRGENVYHGWALFRDPNAGRKASNAIAIPGFMLDVDLRSDVDGIHSKNDQLPTDFVQALEIIDALGWPRPTAIRHSGNGVYFDYLTDELILIDDESRHQIQMASNTFQRKFIAAGRKRGFSFDNVGDLPRITRMPGTLNHKSNPPKPVTLVSFDDKARLTREQLLRIAASEENSKRKYINGFLAQEAETDAAGARLPELASINAGCRWCHYCEATSADDTKRLPEPHWFAYASIARKCRDGARHFHAISSGDPRYNEHETDNKLNRDTKPRTCESIRSDLGFAGCLDCPLYRSEEMKSPIALGYHPPHVAELLGRFVFIVQETAYYDVDTLERYDRAAFTDKFRHKFPTKNPHLILSSNKLLRKPDKTDYLPGVPDRIAEVDGEPVLNLWRHTGTEAKEGDCSIILDHFAYLLSDEQERDHVLDCLASIVQRPQDKIRHALLLKGSQGTGKTFVAELVKQIVGRGNHHTIAGGEIGSEWTAPLLNIQFLVMEEMDVFEKRSVYENTKELITNDYATANQKHEKPRRARTPKLIMVLTNHDNPIALAADDRRFFVANTAAEPRDTAYYKRLWMAGFDQLPAFVHHLSQRNLSSFNPSAHPPMTAAKEALIHDSRPQFEQALEDMMERNLPPFCYEIATMAEIRSALAGKIRTAVPNENAIAQVLRRLGAEYLGQRRIGKNKRARLWAWQNIERWRQASADEIYAALRSRMWGI